MENLNNLKFKNFVVEDILDICDKLTSFIFMATK